ncbi:hypothetical protein KC906_00990, partial [Candidatus Kaiserbacteria bacterium]|nr:hypothetical protein [Candidatus Kaiserbacteria bacterium]
MKNSFTSQPHNIRNLLQRVLSQGFVLAVVAICYAPFSAYALESTGQVYPTLGTSVSESPWSDNAWTTPTNIYTDNAATANVTASTFDSYDQTYVLKATGFDFSSIPDSATILGVTVRVNAWYRSGQGAASIDLCQLLDTSRAKVGTNKCSTPTALTTTNSTVITFGGSSDTWGNALTPAWLKDADFGVALGMLATEANSDVDVDYVSIEVTYTESDGVVFVYPSSIGSSDDTPSYNTLNDAWYVDAVVTSDPDLGGSPGNTYRVPDEDTLHFDAFYTSLIPSNAEITGVELQIVYGAEDGNNASNYVQYNSNNAIQLSDVSDWVAASYDIYGNDPTAVDTIAEIAGLEVTYTNNDTVSSESIYFDQLALLVEYDLPAGAEITKIYPDTKDGSDDTGEALTEVIATDSGIDPDSLNSATASDGAYTVEKSSVLYYSGFDTSSLPEGILIDSVNLVVVYGVEDNYDGTNSVQFLNSSASLQNAINISDIDNWSIASYNISDNDSAAADTLSELTNMEVYFTNNDSFTDGSQSVHFDEVYLQVVYQAEATTTVSGTIYSDAGSTAITSGPTIKLVGATSTPAVYSTTANGSGVYSFTDVPVLIGNPFALYVDGAAGTKAYTSYTVSSTTLAMSDVHLYKDHVIVRSQEAGVVGVDELSFYDSSDDADIQMTASSTDDSLLVGSGNTFYIWPGTTFTAPASTTYAGSLQVEGSYTAAGTAYFTGTSETISGTTSSSSGLGTIVITGSYTMSDNASTTNLTINSGGTLVAPPLLTVSETYANNGTFTANGGHLFLVGGAGTIGTSAKIGGDGVNSSWSSGSFGGVDVLYANGTDLYAGLLDSSGFTGAAVAKFNGTNWSLIGDEADWSGSEYAYIGDIVETPGGSLVAAPSAGYSDGEIWYTNNGGSTWSQLGGRSVGGSWSSAIPYVEDMLVNDTYLYAAIGGSAGDAEVWRYPLGVGGWTKIGGDGANSSWSTSYEYVFALEEIGSNLYAGLGNSSGDAEVWQYNGSTWTKIGGDGTNSSWSSGYERVNSLATDGSNLYAGLGSSAGDAEVWMYNGSSWIQIGGDGVNSSWADSTYELVMSLYYSSGNKLYAGLGTSNNDAEIWEYNSSSWNKIAGDSVNDTWTSTQQYIKAITEYDGDLIAGTTNVSTYDPEIWTIAVSDVPTFSGNFTGSSRLADLTLTEGELGFTSALGTNDLTVVSGATLIASTSLSIAGDLTNNGTLDLPSAGTTTFDGTSLQTLSGTLTGASSLNNVVITNTAGTDASSSPSVIFNAASNSGGQLYIDTPGVMVQFLAGAATDWADINVAGDSEDYVYLFSTASGTQWNVDVSGTTTADYVYFHDANACASASGDIWTTNSVDSNGNNDCIQGLAEFVLVAAGSSTISNHTATQVSNAFNFQNKTNEALYAFRLTPESGNATVTELTVTLSGAEKIEAGDFSNIRLYQDNDNDAAYDAGDTQVGGAGVMSLSGQSGTITFSTDFLITTAANYVVIANWNAPDNGSFITLDLERGGVTTIDDGGTQLIFGDVDRVQHRRNNKGAGGNASVVGTEAPPGREVIEGGDDEGGEQIG